jgi:hypothetical protein
VYHHFVQEGCNFVKVGRVPRDQRIFYLSYYLTGKARDFYDRKVVKDEHTWTLKDFFWGLFNFCFPINFREKQRVRLNNCVQNDKSVTEHISEWEQIYNMIGLEDNQEKVVMLWRSLRADIRQEMYRDKLDPEVSSWDEVTAAAEHAEIILNLNHSDNDQDSEPNNGGESGHSDDADNPGNGGRESRNASSTVVQISSGKRAENKSAGTSNSARGMSEKKRNPYLAAGLCFKCGVKGHLARNCPELTVVVSKQKGKPPGFAAHGVEFVEPSTPDALYESTEVLDTLDVGATSFLGAGMIVEEGEGTRNFDFDSIPAEFFPVSPSTDVLHDQENYLDLAVCEQSVDEPTANNCASSTKDFEHTDSMIRSEIVARRRSGGRM